MEKAFWVVEPTLQNRAYSFDGFFSRGWGNRAPGATFRRVAVQSLTM